MERPRPNFELGNPQAVHQSLTQFTDGISPYELNMLVRSHKKATSALPEGTFSIQTLPPRTTTDYNYPEAVVVENNGQKARSWRTGHNSLVLTYTTPDSQTVPLAIASLTYNIDLLEFSVRRPKSDEDLIISQLAGIRWGPESELTAILKSLRYTNALVEHLKLWQENEHIPSLQILSAELHPSTFDRKWDQLFMIYDVTAKECNFKKQPNGLWLHELSSPQPTDNHAS